MINNENNTKSLQLKVVPLLKICAVKTYGQAEVKSYTFLTSETVLSLGKEILVPIVEMAMWLQIRFGQGVEDKF
jgi:hypothetical protein